MRLFARAAELAGGPDAVVWAEAPATAADIVAALGSQVPALAPLLGRCRLAVNLAFAAPTDAVTVGDELAVIPPVSGG